MLDFKRGQVSNYKVHVKHIRTGFITATSPIHPSKYAKDFKSGH